MRRITLKDGPLDGKTYDVPDNAVRIPAVGGAYRLTPKTGQWEPTKAAKPAQARAARKRETKPKPKPTPGAEVAPADAPVDTATAAVTDAAEQTSAADASE
ncbi:hypothetical protein [Leucobacter chromiiresistens]|uniref:Uncharacterized protein n=1 Tax=Leucobacter chromiiresistens TaxID=1079994 RepID=A0A1H0XQR1_9MICO|nr:hypothetical protein [Leucobacter chromiiresistens]SDQ05121.1 hypothetical protein SAMN04488565_0047 [Leucobacter chromiiresistens]